MSYAVMPLEDYKAVCDKLREKTETTKLITSGEIPQKIDEVYREGQFSVFSSSEALQGKVEGNPISITDVSPVEHDLSVKLSSDTLTDFSSVKVTACGKNLFDKVAWINYCNETGNNEAILNNTYLGETCFSYELEKKALELPVFADISFKVNTQYTFSTSAAFSFRSETTRKVSLMSIAYTDGTAEYFDIYAYSDRFTEFTFTSKANKSIQHITYPWFGNGLYVYCKWLQIEEGTTATAYEEFTGQTYTANADGTVKGVKSIYPSMSISAENSVTISAEYFKDIDKVLENLAINTALSGGE